MVWAPANTFLFINPSPIGRISETGDDSIIVKFSNNWCKQLWRDSALMPLKSIPRAECIVLPYNIRTPALWISFDGGILGCPQMDHSRQCLYNIEQIVRSSKAQPPRIEGRWTVIKMITVGKVQRTKWLSRSIFYRWYDQWTLSKSVKVQ